MSGVTAMRLLHTEIDGVAVCRRSRFKDLRGQVFGRLTVVALDHVDKVLGSSWVTRCECGTTKVIRATAMVQGLTKSCGCLMAEAGRARMRLLNANKKQRGVINTATGYKQCLKCGSFKPLDDFQSDPRHFDGCQSRCKTCTADQRLMFLYGSDLETKQTLIKQQLGRCPGCLREVSERDSLDHDHQTGRVRGVLCDQCNMAIGLLSDDVDRLERLRSYIQGKTSVRVFHRTGVLL